jgi:tryptophan synthase alpha subunit
MDLNGSSAMRPRRALMVCCSWILPPDETLLPDNPKKLLHRIRLVAPTTSAERIKQIVSRADGFIYYVSGEGVTGEREALS